MKVTAVGKAPGSSRNLRVEGIIEINVSEPWLEPSGWLEYVDVTVETEQGEMTRKIKTNANTLVEFSIDVGNHSVRRVILDKYGHVLQASFNSGAFSIVSFLSEQQNSLIVYGTADELASNREAAENLQKALRENWQNYSVPIKSDKEVTEAELKSNHLLLVGRPDSNLIIDAIARNYPSPSAPALLWCGIRPTPIPAAQWLKWRTIRSIIAIRWLL